MPRTRLVLDLTGIWSSDPPGPAGPIAASFSSCLDASTRYIGEQMDRTALSMTIGGLGRLAYGLPSLLAPDWMARSRLAPDLAGEADPRLCLRGFGGLQITLGTFTLLARRSPALRRPASLLNLGADAADLCAGALEGVARRRWDRTVVGSLVVNLLGLAMGGLALSRA